MILEIKRSDYTTDRDNVYMRLSVITSKILTICDRYKITEVYTNVRVGVLLQDGEYFTMTYINTSLISVPPSPYLVGQLKDINIFVDPMMPYTDTRIIESMTTEKLRTLKLHKIQTGENKYDLIQIRLELDESMI